MASNENTPLGNLLGIVGFITGCTIGWNATENAIAAIVVGIILAAMGAFLGNLAWRILIIAISIAIAVFSSLVQREVATAVVTGFKEGFEQGKAAETYQPAQTSTYNYVTCVNNATTHPVHYQYRWGETADWSQIELKPGWGQWHAHDANIHFYIQFDHSYAADYQRKDYRLETYATLSAPACDNAKKYDFYTTGTEIDMRSTN